VSARCSQLPSRLFTCVGAPCSRRSMATTDAGPDPERIHHAHVLVLKHVMVVDEPTAGPREPHSDHHHVRGMHLYCVFLAPSSGNAGPVSVTISGMAVPAPPSRLRQSPCPASTPGNGRSGRVRDGVSRTVDGQEPPPLPTVRGDREPCRVAERHRLPPVGARRAILLGDPHDPVHRQRALVAGRPSPDPTARSTRPDPFGLGRTGYQRRHASSSPMPKR
jgi:hypothetical protein